MSLWKAQALKTPANDAPPNYSSDALADRKSRFMRAMLLRSMPFGHSTAQAPVCNVQTRGGAALNECNEAQLHRSADMDWDVVGV